MTLILLHNNEICIFIKFDYTDKSHEPDDSGDPTGPGSNLSTTTSPSQLRCLLSAFSILIFSACNLVPDPTYIRYQRNRAHQIEPEEKA